MLYLEISFSLGVSYIRSILYTNCITIFFRAFWAANFFRSSWKVGPHVQQQPVHRFPSHQQSSDLNFLTKASIDAKQSINVWIIIERSSYRFIGICSNIIYSLFIVNQSYKYQIWNVSTKILSFNHYVNTWTVLIANQSIHKNKRLLFLHLICFNRKFEPLI